MSLVDSQTVTVDSPTLLRARRGGDAHEANVSLRWLVPFMRVTGASPSALVFRGREPLDLRELANPNSRVSHATVLGLLEAAVVHFGDPCLGLRAGERSEPGDYDVVDSVAASSATFREAIHSIARFIKLLHGALEVRLVEDEQLAIWQLRITDEQRQPAAANDFALACALTFARRYVDRTIRLEAVHMRHATPTSMREYERVFGTSDFKFGAPHNALVFHRDLLAAPMKQAHPGLHGAFELHAAARLDRLLHASTVVGRVRQLLMEQLRGGDVGMTNIASRLGISVPTLRRRLRAEDTAYETLLDGLRRDLAETYLRETSLAIGEITFMLGFAHVSGFYKAFSRWTDGKTPSEFRAEMPLRPSAVAITPES